MASYPQQQTVVMPQQPPPMVQTVNTGPQSIGQVGVQPQNIPTQNPRETNKKSLRGLGIAECVIGALCFLLAVIAIAIIRDEYDDFLHRISYSWYYSGYLYDDSYRVTSSSQGVWSGIFMIVTGILGIRVMNTPTRCLYVANMAMAIITSIVCFCGLVMSGVAAAISAFSEALLSLHAVVGILCFVAMMLAITHAALCCSGVCCNTSTAGNQQVMYVQQRVAHVQPQPQYVQGPGGQLMIVNQPMVANQPFAPQFMPQQASTVQQSPAVIPVTTQTTTSNAPQWDGNSQNALGKSPPPYNNGF